jgi:hypothetical protein
MKTFKTYEKPEGLKPCMKLPIVIHAMQMSEQFGVNTLEGDFLQGKPGDYLMQGVESELYVCDKAIFEKSYNFTK